MVRDVCGIDPADFDYLATSITDNSGRERTTCFAYAVGWTQHTLGAQFIRTAAILQLLLGNVGRPGGGIMALRGHASIQGSTDIPTLFNLLPGYLPMPRWAGTTPSATTSTRSRPSSRRVSGPTPTPTPISLLKAWWGDAATAENDWAYDYLPRLSGPHGTYQTVTDMLADKVDGYFVLGQNPAVGSANGRMQRLGMAQLKWMVVRDLRTDRVGHLVEGRPGDRVRRVAHRGHRDRGVLPAGGDPRGEGRARSPRPSGWCSGGTRQSTRRVSARANWTSSTSWERGSGRSWPTPPIRATARCWT